jgi:hypothetical protein
MAMVLSLLSCTGIRNNDVYNLEVNFLGQVILKQNELLKQYLDTQCCYEHEFTDSKQCREALDTYLTSKVRVPYHLDMMRYLGRFTEEKPVLPALSIVTEGICE